MKTDRKRGLKRKIVYLTAAALLFSGVPFTSHATSSTRQEIADKENEKDQIEDQIDASKQEISGLKGEQKSLRQQLTELNEQLTAVSDHLAELEAQIRDKEQEIADTVQALAEARGRGPAPPAATWRSGWPPWLPPGRRTYPIPRWSAD